MLGRLASYIKIGAAVVEGLDHVLIKTLDWIAKHSSILEFLFASIRNSPLHFVSIWRFLLPKFECDLLFHWELVDRKNRFVAGGYVASV